jgi:hypothetical protein
MLSALFGKHDFPSTFFYLYLGSDKEEEEELFKERSVLHFTKV